MGILTLTALSLLMLSAYGQAFAKGGGGGGTTGTDGRIPFAGLIMDGKGNLYGTTANGGAYSDGVVFELTPNGVGGWKESILHSFNGTDGKFPESGLVIDGSGDLYGASIYGGAGNKGTVFELTRPVTSGGAWTESVLLSFNGTNGAAPHDALMMDSGGNLYGTAQSGGAKGFGTVFKLTKSGGIWTPSVLYSFIGGLSDGSTPVYSSLIADSSGKLYGTTLRGGTYSSGTVYNLTPSGTSWTESVLYSFEGGTPDGKSPNGLIFGTTTQTSGILYGTTGTAGTFGAGTVFRLPSSGGGLDSILYDFTGGLDGSGPHGVIADASGNFFGTTAGGGANGLGTVFELSAGGAYSVLHSFNGTDGNDPEVGLMMDSSGNLYGTTTGGGTTGWGTVFKLTNNAGVWSESVLYSFM